MTETNGLLPENWSGAGPEDVTSPDGEVTALYAAHATGLVRLAVLMLGGDQGAAEDVVQEAFFGLYRSALSSFRPISPQPGRPPGNGGPTRPAAGPAGWSRSRRPWRSSPSPRRW